MSFICLATIILSSIMQLAFWLLLFGASAEAAACFINQVLN